MVRLIVFSVGLALIVVTVAVAMSAGPINYLKALQAGVIAFTFSAVAFRLNASRNA